MNCSYSDVLIIVLFVFAVDCGVCGTVSQFFAFVFGDLLFHGVPVTV